MKRNYNMSNLSAIDKAIAEAEAAKNNQPIIDAVPAVNQTTGVTSYVPAKPMSLDDAMSGGGLAVDAYLKVTPTGLIIGEALKSPIQEITVLITMSDMDSRAYQVVRASAGSSTEYFKTRDGVTCENKGGSWAEALRKADLIQPGSRPYNSVDLEMEVAEDIYDASGKTLLAKAGSTLGKGLSYSDMKSFKNLHKDIKALGKLDVPVKVKIEALDGVKGTNTYGFLKFVLVD